VKAKSDRPVAKLVRPVPEPVEVYVTLLPVFAWYSAAHFTTKLLANEEPDPEISGSAALAGVAANKEADTAAVTTALIRVRRIFSP